MTTNSDNSPVSEDELRRWAESLNDIGPARFQEAILFADRYLAVGLYRERLLWLVLDLNLEAPHIFTGENLASLGKKETKKPLTLFLAAHFRGAVLSRAEVRPGFGRVLWLIFEPAEGARGGQYEIELRLFARGANAIARAGEKTVALHKPLPLKPMAEQKPEASVVSVRAPPPKIAPAARVPTVDARIAKVEKAIAKVAAELESKTTQQWHAAGEWLKREQRVSAVAPEFAKYIDIKKSLVWNIQNCFAKGKAAQKKLAGTEARLKELQRELEKLKNSPPGDGAGEKAAPKQPKLSGSMLYAAEARGRTFDLASGLHFFVGRSAADNLKLLREAKPWHFWLHVRDYPGSHGILARNKNQAISDDILQRAAHHLLNTQFGPAKSARYNREKFEILVAECRFVRPIRGDRSGGGKGQVTYTDARSFVHQFNVRVDAQNG